MAQIRFPTRETPQPREGKQSGAGFGQKLGAGLGAAAGLVTGGPIGAVKGAATGASIGGTIGGLAQPGSPGEMVQQAQQTQGLQANTGAVDRRLQEIQQNPHFQLQQAAAALPQLPADIQKQYAPTIEMALAASRKAQQVGRA